MSDIASAPGERRTPYLAAVVIVVAALSPLVAYVGNLAFAPLLAAAGIACLPLAGVRRAPSLGMGILLALLVWALVSLAWSPAAPHAFRRYKDLEGFTGLKLVFELALYGAFVMAVRGLSAGPSRRALLVLGVGFAVVAAVLLLEAGRGAELYQWIKAAAHQATRPDLARRNVARATYAIALLIWPLGLSLSARGWPFVILLTALGAVASAFAFNVDAPVAALVAGSIAFLMVRQGGRVGVWLVTLAVMLYFAAAPLAVLLVERVAPSHQAIGQVGKLSWSVRLDVWRFVVDRILERPFLGWGLDASRTWPGVVPLHPHDAALQIWLELGMPGAFLAVLFFGWLFSRLADVQKRDPSLAAAGAASAIAYVTIGALSFGVWQEWWLALGALAVACILLLASSRRDVVRSTETADDLVPIGGSDSLRPLPPL